LNPHVRLARFPAQREYFQITRHLSAMSEVAKAVFCAQPRLCALASI
jgi:hypothetical protein